jgi:hypothetical protein
LSSTDVVDALPDAADADEDGSDMMFLPLPELPGQVLTVLGFPRSQPMRAPAVIDG